MYARYAIVFFALLVTEAISQPYVAVRVRNVDSAVLTVATGWQEATPPDSDPGVGNTWFTVTIDNFLGTAVQLEDGVPVYDYSAGPVTVVDRNATTVLNERAAVGRREARFQLYDQRNRLTQLTNLLTANPTDTELLTEQASLQAQIAVSVNTTNLPVASNSLAIWTGNVSDTQSQKIFSTMTTPMVFQSLNNAGWTLNTSTNLPVAHITATGNVSVSDDLNLNGNDLKNALNVDAPLAGIFRIHSGEASPRTAVAIVPDGDFYITLPEDAGATKFRITNAAGNTDKFAVLSDSRVLIPGNLTLNGHLTANLDMDSHDLKNALNVDAPLAGIFRIHSGEASPRTAVAIVPNGDTIVTLPEDAGATKFRVMNAAGNADKFTVDSNSHTRTLGDCTVNGTFTALNDAFLPRQMLLNISRVLPTTVDNTVDIGTFTDFAGSHGMRISLVIGDSNTSATKTYELATFFDHTAGVWKLVPALIDSGHYANNDFALEAKESSGALVLRIRRTSGSNTATVRGAILYTIDAPSGGSPIATFSASTAVTVGAAAVTTYLVSTTDLYNVNVKNLATIPTLNVTVAATVRGLAPSLALYEATVDSTITATGSQTYNTSTSSFNSNELNVVGRHLRVTLAGQYTSGAAPGTTVISFAVGGSAFSSPAIALTALQTDAPFRGAFDIVVRTTGTGTARWIGDVYLSTAAGVQTRVASGGIAAGVDWTGTPNLSALNNFNTSGNSITLQVFTIEEVH